MKRNPAVAIALGILAPAAVLFGPPQPVSGAAPHEAPVLMNTLESLERAIGDLAIRQGPWKLCFFRGTTPKGEKAFVYKGLARIDGLWAPPYLATNFQLTLLVADKEPPAADWAWWPFKVRRTAVVEGVRITTDTVLAAGRRAGIVSVALENTGAETRDVPLRCDVRGAPEYSIGWGFRPPASRATAAPAAISQTPGACATCTATWPSGRPRPIALTRTARTPGPAPSNPESAIRNANGGARRVVVRPPAPRHVEFPPGLPGLAARVQRGLPRRR